MAETKIPAENLLMQLFLSFDICNVHFKRRASAFGRGTREGEGGSEEQPLKATKNKRGR